MISNRLPRIATACASIAWLIAAQPTSPADAATLEQALGLAPIQRNVEYTIPTKEEAAGCVIAAEKEGGQTAWVVRDAQGLALRRFADTKGDNVVDRWCYYLDGLEVYRDIDSNHNGKADQYRWFHTAGTRWGVDQNEDGRIDSWRVISPQEVAEELVLALKTRDQQRFELLLLKPAELTALGLGKQRADAIAESIKTAAADFRKLAAEQKVVTSESRFVDFGSSRPATIPAGTAGSTKDVTVFENASALVETGGKHEQVFLGTLVAVGNAWKVIDLPAIGPDSEQSPGGFFLTSTATPPTATPGAAAGAPSEEMQELMAQLEQLDRQAANTEPDRQGALTEKRADLLLRLAEVTTDPALREQWYRQLAVMLSVAVQSGAYPDGMERLDELAELLTGADADSSLVAHVELQRMWAEYVSGHQDPDADTAEIQKKWLADLESFVERHPKSPDAAEALLQLGMYQEFIGNAEEAQQWYERLVADFPSAGPAGKARGAVARLNATGKPIRLRAQDMQGSPFDLANLRGKVVVVQYWASWSEPAKLDMNALKDLYAKHAPRGFEIVGIALDDSAADARQFVQQNRYPWKQLHEPGGLDSRLANEMGIITVPLMMLVDQQGNVVRHNIQVAELEAELERLLTR